MDAVVKFLEKVDPERATKAKQRYSCFDKCALRCCIITARRFRQHGRVLGQRHVLLTCVRCTADCAAEL